MAKVENNIILQGMTGENGGNWLGNGTTTAYEGSIPLEDLRTKLFGWNPVRIQHTQVFTDENGNEDIATSDKYDFVRPAFAGLPSRVVGTHSSSYSHRGYDALVDRVQNILDDEIAVHSAGLLKDGGQAFIQFGLANKRSVLDGDDYVPYITILDSMDGTKQDQTITGCIRLACQNMIAASVREAFSSYKAKHTKNYTFRIADARIALELLNLAGDTFEAEVQAMLDFEVTNTEFEAIVDAISPLDPNAKRIKFSETKRDHLFDLWHSDPMVATLPDSLYKVEQVVNTYERHHAIQRGVEDRTTRVVERMVKGGWNALDLATVSLVQNVLKRDLQLAA